jgi:molybdopterin-guanine dinucleotide biosynthesis adapter protein
MSQKAFGVTGWKNSGKTSLAARLIGELAGRGYRVSAVKHAHESFDVDQEGRDSFKLREAGASQVALSSPKRFALMQELRGEDELDLDAVLARLLPCDVVIVEGYKHEAIPKIEARRDGAVSRKPLAAQYPEIVAIASDRPHEEKERLPVFHLDDIAAIADFIVAHLGLRTP